MTGQGGYGNGRVPHGHRSGPGAYGHRSGPGAYGHRPGPGAYGHGPGRGAAPRRRLARPQNAARRVFDPPWIPEPVDPLVEGLKRVRVVAGLVTALGVYTVVAGGFSLEEALENVVVASLVLLVVTPLTVGVLLMVWRSGGPIRPLRGSLWGSLNLLLRFVGTALLTFTVLRVAPTSGLFVLLLGPLGLWLLAFLGCAAVRLNANFFGTAAVHRALPPVLATVTAWLTAVPDLVTGDLHGLGLRLGVVFILGAPVTVTALGLLETRRLRRHHGVRLRSHPLAPGAR
ncbi:hypothetical protein MMF93_12820 [Streptomyces tubbatahanensis]|uniref:Integral membrane protein n=1 Tax=Streptomyces tubbatahanensis TaxID=2923272 RepID=A0ABY3XS75_9ACTN|nr:hypothetical protein [Streptomyces tubbatahanensis]UNS97287.1 hypothetical protein MMF93_12820 [Streptomyces tubbatahanensis]